jgi:Flp pilus assembly protein TadG
MQRWNLRQTLSYRLRRRARDERGQALVEFAVVLPVLILIIMGIVYFGRYMNYSNQMTQLAEEGARWASVDYDPPGTELLQAYITSQVSGELANGSSDVTTPVAVYIYYPTSNPTPYNTVGQSLRVCVVATVKYPFLGTSGLSSTIAEYATMRIEAVDTPATSFVANTTSIPSQCPQT